MESYDGQVSNRENLHSSISFVDGYQGQVVKIDCDERVLLFKKLLDGRCKSWLQSWQNIDAISQLRWAQESLKYTHT